MLKKPWNFLHFPVKLCCNYAEFLKFYLIFVLQNQYIETYIIHKVICHKRGHGKV